MKQNILHFVSGNDRVQKAHGLAAVADVSVNHGHPMSADSDKFFDNLIWLLGGNL